MSANVQVDLLGNTGRRISDVSRLHGAARSSMRAFEVLEECADYLKCAKVASLDSSQQPIADTVPEGQSETIYRIAKPWMLRNTPFDGETRDTVSYATRPTGYDYTGLPINLRKASKAPTEEELSIDENAQPTIEWQRLTPDYTIRKAAVENVSPAQKGELITAFNCIPFDVTEGEGESAESFTISLCDLNNCGRCWAETDQPPESE